MNTFIKIFVECFIPAIVVGVTVILFFSPDSACQKRMFRKTLTRLAKSEHDKLDIIYKNRKFKVAVAYKKINNVYSYYEICINGALAATFHKLNHGCRYSCRFREENKRHRSEVEAIIYAADKALKLEAKPKKVKENGYIEYSYFN